MEAYLHIDNEKYWVKLVSGQKATWIELSKEQIERLDVEGFVPKMEYKVD